MIRVSTQRIADDINNALMEKQDEKFVTLRQLGERIGLCDATLCRLSRQVRVADLKSISLIAAYFKRDVLYYFDTSDSYVNLSRLPKKVRAAVEDMLKNETQRSRK